MNKREQRRVGFTLPPEVFSQLLEEQESVPELHFWENLRVYYKLSPILGDTIICTPDFLDFITLETGCDQPPWVYSQGGFTEKNMECYIIAGPGRGEELLQTLREIERAREEAEQEQQKRNQQIDRIFHSQYDMRQLYEDYVIIKKKEKK